MVYIANRMQARPNRVQTAVETLYALMRDNITRGNMDDKMAAKWFPFIGTLFLFIWFSNLIGYIPLPTNTHETVRHRRPRDPRVRDLRRDGEHLDPARARADRLRLLQRRGHPRQGRRRLPEEPDPRRACSGAGGGPASSCSSSCRTSCGCISLSVRLFANILAGHLIILFMSGGLAVLLGLEVARRRSRCRSASSSSSSRSAWSRPCRRSSSPPSSAIYLGGAVAEHH